MALFQIFFFQVVEYIINSGYLMALKPGTIKNACRIRNMLLIKEYRCFIMIKMLSRDAHRTQTSCVAYF